MSYLRQTPHRARLRGLAASLIAVLAAVVFVVPAAAGPTPTLPVPWPLDSVITYRWAAGATPPIAMRTALAAGAADATASRRSRAPSYVYDTGAGNGIAYGVESPCVVAWIACMRRDVPTGFAVWFRENGRRYDWGTLRWCEVSGVSDGCFSAETVMLDELGHVDGLDHHVNRADESDYTDSVVQTISRARPEAGWNADDFGRCDVATLQQVYDVAVWTTPYSTCLDVPTVLTLVTGPVPAGSGGIVTFTASLRSDGTGRLDGNPVAGRAVVLQGRLGLAWADVGSMAAAPSAGTYTLGLASRSSTEYRAVFRAPASEGLRGSTSVSVAIGGSCSVSPCPLGIPALAAPGQATR